MSNKVFIFLVVVLVILIIISSVFLVLSIMNNQGTSYPQGEKPSVLTDRPAVSTEDSSKDSDIIPTPKEEEKVEEKKEGKAPTSTTTSTSKDEKYYILPSDTEKLTKEDLNGMDYDLLNKAYNEIFARHGHDFKTQSLKEYFEEQNWYKPESGKTVTDAELTELEKSNLELIKARIAEVKK